jgi:stearoyl-CoA desaturase (delta-9 desaturase)
MTRTSAPPIDPSDARFDPLAAAPLLAMHGAGLAVLWTGVSAVALGVAAALFVARAFALTAGYHRYFAHRSFRTSRAFQLALAWLGASAAQMGPLWWAGHHRRHHRWSDRAGDPHSPVEGGLFWSHIGWLLCRRNVRAPLADIPDFARFAELRWLDRWHAAAPLSLALACAALGAALARLDPALGTSAAQMLAVGFLASTLALYHVTYAVNSLAHRFGSQRYDAGDGSRNNPVLALLALGDGWHNNHHRFPKAARHGFYWWELDPTWLGLRALAALGLVWDLAPVPGEAYAVAPRARSAKSAAATASPQATPNESPTRA